jgi:hypothetical protein
MPLLTEAEYLQRYLNHLRRHMSFASYGTPVNRTNRSRREALKNKIHEETLKTAKKLREALNRNKTIIHHNVRKANSPRTGASNWLAKKREANRYKQIIPKAQALRNKILERRALAIVRRYWMQPPVVGRGYLRLQKEAEKRWSAAK